MARGTHYRIERKQDVRRFKPINIVIWALISLLLVVALAFFIISKSSGKTAIDISGNKPIAGQVESASSSYIAFEEPEYKLLLPNDWQEKERRADKYYNYVTYESVGDTTTGRSLTIYRKYNRDVPAVTRIMPVTILEDRIITQGISEQCYRFTNLKAVPLDEPAPSKWENVNFMCNPQKLHHILGVGTVEDGFGINIKGQHFAFIFTDHSAHPDDGIFIKALRSFEAK